MTLMISSSVFEHEGQIPAKFTCEGADPSPPLAWSGFPPETRSFVLIVDDPDAPDPKAPKMVYVHWVLYDIPASQTSFAEGASTSLPAGTREGENDWKRTGWGGPCPPIGQHRYYFKLYALDALLGDLGAVKKPDLLAAMEGHVIAQATLMGTYEKQKR